MSSLLLSAYLDNAEFALRRQIKLLTEGKLVRRVGIHAMCTMFRKRGTCSLLLTGDTSLYYVSAMQSAAAFLHYLKTAAADDKVTSFAKPLFDGISGGYWDAARDIALLSRPTHNADFEYEDDFLYVRFLHEFFFLNTPEGQQRGLLERYEKVLEGKPDVRLDICRTFMEHDVAGFDLALQALLNDRTEALENLVTTGGTTDEEATWLRPYSNEATALLKLAERVGFATQESYGQVPDDIRPESRFRFAPDAWVDLNFVPVPR